MGSAEPVLIWNWIGVSTGGIAESWGVQVN
jgi:hypothetical protein